MNRKLAITGSRLQSSHFKIFLTIQHLYKDESANVTGAISTISVNVAIGLKPIKSIFIFIGYPDFTERRPERQVTLRP